MNRLSIDPFDGCFGFPLLLPLRIMYWGLDFGVCVQSNNIHPVVPLPWLFLKYRVGQNKLHLSPPLPATKVSHVLEMIEQDGIGLTTWTYAHT